MAGGMYGADVAQLRALGHRFDLAADEIERCGRLVGQGVTTTVQWVGPSAAEFRAAWAGTHHPRVDGAVATLRNAAQKIRANAEEQQRTSSAEVDLGDLRAAIRRTLDSLSWGGDRIPDPPIGRDPEQAREWWETLSSDERDDVIAKHPDWIGNRDGIPAWARDRANRSLIEDYRSELEEERDRLKEALSNKLLARIGLEGLLTNEDRQLELIEAKLLGLDRIGDVVGEDFSSSNRQLLVLDITGEQQLKAAVAVGDLDTADHVAVFTPGMTSTVQGSLKDIDRDMAALRTLATAESAKYGDGGTVATVAWLGYEAPQWNGLQGLDRSVLTDSLAKRGAADLAQFYGGIDASRDVDPHITALGHSYGSTTTGLALQRTHGVDDAVFFGSPGIGTGSVADLHLSPGHAYAMETWDDVLVADSGWFGGDPSRVEGIQQLWTGRAGIYGPTERAEFESSSGHSEYLKARSTSQHNLAVIVAGVPERAIPL